MHEDCILYPCETVEQENCCIRDCGRYKSKYSPNKIAIFASESFGDWCKYQNNKYRITAGCTLRENYCSQLECPIVIESLKKNMSFYTKYLDK